MVANASRLWRRIAIGIGGSAVFLAGVIMLVIPGPGIAAMLLGLGILSLEFERPRIWLARIKARAVKLKDKVRRKPPSSGA